MTEKRDRSDSERREVRFVPLEQGRVEVRAEEDDDTKTLEGRVNTFGSVADLGGFTEEVAPGFFEEAIGRDDVRGLFNHDVNYPLARHNPERDNNTMELSESDGGLDYRIPEMPKSREDVVEAIERGDVDGNSFSFEMPPNEEGEEWLDEGPKGKPHRILKRPKRLYDVGPVTFQAYSEGTDVQVRSADEIYREHRQLTEEEVESRTEPEEEAATEEDAPESRDDGGCGCGESSDDDPAEQEAQEVEEDEERGVPAEATYRLAEMKARAGKRREGDVSVSGGGDVESDTEKSASGSVSVQGGG